MSLRVGVLEQKLMEIGADETKAEGIMMNEQTLQNAFQDPGIEFLSGFKHERLIPIVRVS